MHSLHSIGRFLVIPIGLACSLHAFADWKFDPAKSDLSATFTDQRTSGNVNHVYHVQNLQGTIDAQGHLSIPLQLSQLDLMNGLPDWVTAMIGSQNADITGTIDPTWFNLSEGQSITRSVPLTFTSHHHSRTQSVDLKMTRMANGNYQVTTARPMFLHANELMKESYSHIILSTLGYQNLAENVPIALDAQITHTQ